MRKIGIITIEGNKNYGNKLQNYALQKKIEEYGFECYTLWQKEKKIRYLKRNIKKIIVKIFKNNKQSAKAYRREKSFVRFTKEYLKIKIVNRKKLYKLDSIFSGYIIGSDQVWNPDIIDTYLGIDILNNKNRIIAYAPSIAQMNVNESYMKKVQKNFTKEKIPFISLREETGKRLVEEITMRDDVECTLDPTMLLGARDWDKIIKKPVYLNDSRFVLCYFLGELSPDRKNMINEFAKKHDCKIINILDFKDEAYFLGPNEFLYLEKNAFAIFTDSFHSSVFGFIFDTLFYIFDREDEINDMSSRLVDFMERFKLKDRHIKENNMDLLKVEHDYSEGYKVLKLEQKHSEDFLKNALNFENIDKE